MKILLDYRPMENAHKTRGLGQVVKNIYKFWPKKEDITKLSLDKSPDVVYKFRFIKRRLLRFNPILDYFCSHFFNLKYDFFLASDFNFYPRANQFRGKIVSILYDTHAFDSGEKNNFFKRYSFSQLKDHYHHIAISEYTKESFVSEFGIPSDKISVIWLGYDSEKYNSNLIKLNIAEEKFIEDKISNKNYFFYVGGSNENKNIGNLIEAFNKIEKDIYLLLVGIDHLYNKKILSLINESNNRDRIILLGQVSDTVLKYLYQNSLGFVFPSFKEGFGLPILEAMACGAPVISSNTTSLPEVGGDAVYYINPNSVNEIFIAMELFINDKKLREQYSLKGLERVKAFSWEITTLSINNLLKSI